jgi:hypothetical protein
MSRETLPKSPYEPPALENSDGPCTRKDAKV